MSALVRNLAANTTLIAAITAWILAQVIKIVREYFNEGEFDLTKLMASGGMPSGHAAVVTAVAMGIAREHGLSSSEFAMASVFALVVMYDAAGVRQAVGIQAQMMNEVLHDLYHRKGTSPVRIREILGHTPLEVVAGAFLGAFVSIVI